MSRVTGSVRRVYIQDRHASLSPVISVLISELLLESMYSVYLYDSIPQSHPGRASTMSPMSVLRMIWILRPVIAHPHPHLHLDVMRRLHDGSMIQHVSRSLSRAVICSEQIHRRARILRVLLCNSLVLRVDIHDRSPTSSIVYPVVYLISDGQDPILVHVLSRVSIIAHSSLHVRYKIRLHLGRYSQDHRSDHVDESSIRHDEVVAVDDHHI